MTTFEPPPTPILEMPKQETCCVFLLGHASEIVCATANVEQLFGNLATPGVLFESLFAEGDRKGIKQLFQNSAAQGQDAVAHIVLVLRATGEESPCRVSVSACHEMPASSDLQGVKFICTIQDLSELRNKESAVRTRMLELARKFAFLQASVETIRGNVIACDMHGALKPINNSVKKFYAENANIEYDCVVEPPSDVSAWDAVVKTLRPDGTEIPMDERPLARALRGEIVVNEIIIAEPVDGHLPRRAFLCNARPVNLVDGGEQFECESFAPENLGAVVAAEDITDRRADQERYRELFEKAQALSAHLLSAQEQERRTIARELHDEMGQSLTAIKLDLLDLREASQPNGMTSRLSQSIAVVDRLIEQVRSLSLNLRPPLLDDLGLRAALKWFLEQQTQRTNLDIQFSSEGFRNDRFDAAVEITCFRVVQEALTNIVRHAGATSVIVNLYCEADNLCLLIRDNGVGFETASARFRSDRGESMGLLGMTERVELAGGQFLCESAPGRGTEIRATFPIV